MQDMPMTMYTSSLEYMALRCTNSVELGLFSIMCKAKDYKEP